MNPPPQFFIRPMMPADIAWAKALADSTSEAPHWPSAAYDKALDSASLLRRIAVVAEIEATPSGPLPSEPRSGFAIACLIPPQAEIETIVVSAAARRSGLGRGLMASLVASLKPANITEVTLEVRASNKPALAFYRSAGFRECGRRVRYYVDPIEDAILLAWNLR